MNDQFLYRCELVVSGPSDDDLLMAGRAYVYRHRFPIIKTTHKGKWIDVYGKRRWVSDTSTKRFALPSEAEADKSFLCRQRRREYILENALHQVKNAIAMHPKDYHNVY